MSRIKIALPLTDPVFQHEIDVRITDLNYGNHLANQVVLEYCHEARMQFLHSIEQSEMSFLGGALVMSDAAVVYKSEGFWKNKIHVAIYISETNMYGFDLVYLLKTDDNKEIARAKTGMVFFNYEVKKLMKAPEGLESALFVNS